MLRRYTHRLLVALVCLGSIVPETIGQALGYEVLRFDAGPAEHVAEHHLPLPSTTRYGASRGYGWLSENANDYDRPELLRSREARLRDGVRSNTLTFRVDLPPGAWRVMFWMEAGMQDSSTVAFRINGEPSPLHWQAFNPPAELRTQPQNMYRMHQAQVLVGEDGLELAWTNNADEVGLMGLLLVPEPTPQTPTQQALFEQLSVAGRYPVEASLTPLVEATQAAYERDPNDAFAAYWREQIHTLAKAERYLEDLRGWEWASDSTGLSIFQRYHQIVMWLDGILAHADPENFPLYERALWQRGRILYWLNEERGGPNERRSARRDLATLYARHPDDALLSMYLGARVDVPDHCDARPAMAHAPAWAIGQREVLCRLRSIAYWWVNERQAPNGEFGGKLGDDVELLRWWTPLIMAGDTVALRGWQRLAEGVWVSPKLQDGYFRAPIDVEHAAEPIADTAPVLAFVSDDPTYIDRLRYSTDYFINNWTVRKDNGRRYFRSAWFGSTQIDERPPRNRDLEMNTRAAKAVRYYAWLTGDAATEAALHEWARAWADAAMRTDKGKPRGLIPASIRASDEALNGDEPTWYQANMYWPYFDWPQRDGSMMLDHLLFTYRLTGDATLLDPLFATFDLLQRHPTTQPDAAPGSAAWAADVIRSKQGVWRVAGQWRLLHDDDRYDDLLLRYGSPYLRYRLTGDEGHLAEITQTILEKVRYNTPMLTSEAFVTDRVYITPSGSRSASASDLKAMLTGDGSAEDASPYAAVTWEGTPKGFTALVADTGPRRLGVQFYLFEQEDATLTARLWQLQPGRYSVTLADAEGRTMHTDRITVAARGQRLVFLVPPHTLVQLTIYPAK